MSYPTGQGPSNVPAAGAPLSAEQDRQWASLAHLGGILSFPPALIIWLVFKDRGTFTSEEGKTALNFQITLLIGYVAINLAATVLGLLTWGLLSVIGSLVWVLWLIGSVCSVLGYLSAKDGRPYRYPFSLRLIS